MKMRKRTGRAALFLALLMIAAAILSQTAFSEEEGTIVRVGWYTSPFNQIDEFGRRSGYAYDYQQKIAAYTGWKYEYVTGSWPELLVMLEQGRIDLLSDVSYTEERAEKMYFSNLSMGEEEYCVYVAPGNDTISAEKISSLDGKTVGVNKGSVQKDQFEKWERENGVKTKIVELTDDLEGILRMLKNGDIDAFVEPDGFISPDVARPLFKIGGSEFYFAVSTDRPGLLDALNSAMNRIISEDPFYNYRLSEKYIKLSVANLYLSTEEKTWLKEHGAIRVGYQDNYLAFCAKDPETGELTGALKDYLDFASDCLENAVIKFEPVCYPTASAAMEAMKNGEVDCMFPANLTDYDGEVQGCFMTSPIMRTDISAVVLESERDGFMDKEHVTVAVNAGNPNYDMFLIDHFPEWRSVVFEDTPECLRAIRDKKADCLLLSNYRYNNIAHLCKKYGLVSLSTGVEMDYSFAVARSSVRLYSILNKVADVVPNSTVNSALTYHFTEDAKQTLGEMLLEHIWAIAAGGAVILIVILFLVFKILDSGRKAARSEKLVTAAERDPLTRLYTKSFFYAYADRIYREDPERPMDAAVLNVEQFHSVNSLHGWGFGDNVIRALGDGICAFVKERGGIGGHAEADRFAIFFPHSDDYGEIFESFQKILNELSPNAKIKLRMGVMPWESGLTPHELIEGALMACGLARGRYKEHIVVFDDAVRERESREQRLLNDIDRAVGEKEFEVYYQPKFDVRSDTPALIGAEALVRWNHREFGTLFPGDFIPLFEKNGQIEKIDRFVREQAASQIARWKKDRGVSIPVSVNLSRIDLFDPELGSSLDALVEAYGLERKELELEVTESAYIENADDVARVIGKLRNKGYAIEMDDFGTGYSSLNLLADMPVDVLKLDRAFVKNAGRGENADRMIEVILEIAKKLGLPVVAEGVETAEQLALLKKLGCGAVQGFYFSRPIPSAEFEERYLK